MRVFANRAIALALLMTSTALPSVVNAQVAEPLLPPNAKPGECYTRLYIPPTYDTQTERVLKRAASEKVDVVPAKLETIEEQVLVKEETEVLEIIPPTFKTIEERVMVRPETEEIVATPAEYEDVEEQILIKPAYVTWKKGRGPIEKADATTGEIMCLVEVPAEYKAVTKRVVKTPPQTKVVKKPAEYVMVKRQVVDRPAQTKPVKVPAEYKAVKVIKVVEPAKEVRSPISEEYDTVTKTVKKTDGGLEWKQILCETNVTPEIIRKIQTALKDNGVYKGPLDGSLGPSTMVAIANFQKANNLPAGQLTMETLKALKIPL